MARWRLMSAHYLNVPGTEYEHREVSRETGKQAVKRYPVPLFLNPNDPADCNYPGEIIVADKANRLHPKDLVFVGPPTPEMEPLDEEAEKISAKHREKWDKHPIESLPTTMSQL